MIAYLQFDHKPAVFDFARVPHPMSVARCDSAAQVPFCRSLWLRNGPAKKLRGSHRGHEGHRGNIKVVRTRPAPNFTLSLKIFKDLCDLRDLCVSQFPHEILSRTHRPTALFAGNDTIAVEAIFIAEEAGEPIGQNAFWDYFSFPDN